MHYIIQKLQCWSFQLILRLSINFLNYLQLFWFKTYVTEHIWLRIEFKRNIWKWPSGDSNLRPSNHKFLQSDGIFRWNCRKIAEIFSWYVVQHAVIAYERDSCGKSRIPFGKTEKSIWDFLQWTYCKITDMVIWTDLFLMKFWRWKFAQAPKPPKIPKLNKKSN